MFASSSRRKARWLWHVPCKSHVEGVTTCIPGRMHVNLIEEIGLRTPYSIDSSD